MVILTIVHVIISIALIAVVLFQSGSDDGVPGVISGGSDSFFGKNGARTSDALFARCTTVLAVLFIITSVVLSLIIK